MMGVFRYCENIIAIGNEAIGMQSNVQHDLSSGVMFSRSVRLWLADPVMIWFSNITCITLTIVLWEAGNKSVVKRFSCTLGDDEAKSKHSNRDKKIF